MKNVKKLSSHSHTGFGQKSGSHIDGFVVIKYNNKKTYVGEFKKNQKNGQGVSGFGMTYYIGKYQDDWKVDGIVYAMSNDQVVYTGGWGKDNYHGFGKLTRLNGQKYEGQFDYGQLHGQGKMTFLNNDVYEGEFQKSVR